MTLSRVDIEIMEAAGQELLRHGVAKEGLALLAVALKHRPSDFSVRVPDHFACEIDESAGMAELYELRREMP